MQSSDKLLRRYGFFISYALALLFIIFFIYYVSKYKEQFVALRYISPSYLVVIAALVVLFKLTIGLKMKFMLNSFGIALRFREWFGLTCIYSLTNYITPVKAGIIPQALYLKKNRDFRYTQFATYLASFAIFILAINSFLGILFLAYYYIVKGRFFFVLFMLFFLTFVTSLIVIYLFPHLERITIRVKWQWFNRIISGLTALKGKRILLLRLFAAQMADIFFSSLRLFFAYRALGLNIDVLGVFIIGLFVSSSAIVSITPANLGIRELSIVFSSALIGRGAASGLMVSLIDRGLGALVTFVLGAAYTYILMRKKE